MDSLLAFTPLLYPIDAHRFWWLLLVPLAILISVVYKALRLPSLGRYPLGVAIMTMQVLGGMFLLGAAAYIFVVHLAPIVLPVRP